MMKNRKSIIEYLETSVERFLLRRVLLDKRSKRLSYSRLTIFFAGILITVALFLNGNSYAAWIALILFIIPFGILTGIQNKVDLALKKNDIWTNIKKIHLARIRIDWEKIPLPINHEPDYSHPFDGDLNITGRYSLLHFLDYSNSVQGNHRLKEWLLSKHPVPGTIARRQALVRELVAETKFRDKVVLASRMISKDIIDGERISNNITKNNHSSETGKVLRVLLIMSALNIILFGLYYIQALPPFFVITISAYAAFYFFNVRYAADLFDRTTDLESDLGKFIPVMEFLESYHYKSNSNLKEFCSSFTKHKPSQYFRRIKRIAYAVSFQKNPFLVLILNLAFPWDLFFAHRYEKLKSSISENLHAWLDTWYELEGLISLANLKALNPEYSFPTITGDQSSPTPQPVSVTNQNIAEPKTSMGESLQSSVEHLQSGAKSIPAQILPVFEMKQGGHPLIPYEQNVKNDFTLTAVGEGTIITGSNMSGKSTFIKTIGINLVLAYAGGAVNASFLCTSLFRLNTCIKISDSVTEGISYFYAEVKRLKFILNEIKSENTLPVFYLIDEIFRGTNNIERLTGSKSYIKAIAKLNCCGLVTTHDLELVRLEDEIQGIKNYHFREETEGGRMIFDYKLRTGPSPTTNALKIMALEGLPVDPQFMKQ